MSGAYSFNRVRHILTARRALAVFVLAAAIAAVLAVASAYFSPQYPRLFKIATPAHGVILQYFNSTRGLLLIRPYLRGEPVEAYATIIAIGPGKIWQAAYATGYGAIEVNLSSPGIREAAKRWAEYLRAKGAGPDSLWPSLLVFVTYVKGNYSRTSAFAVPYPPLEVSEGEGPEIVALVDLSAVEPVPLRAAEAQPPRPSSTLHGFSGPYNCSEQAYQAAWTAGLSGCTEAGCYVWSPNFCDGYNGTVPQIWAAWDGGVARRNAGALFLDIITGGNPIQVQSGAGLYGTGLLTGQKNLALIGPTITFSPSYTGYVVYKTPDNVIGNININGSSSGTSVSQEAALLNYYVDRPGAVYMGPDESIGVAQFQMYECPSPPSSCSPTNQFLNATIPLNVLSLEGNNLYFYTYLDLGNGSATAMLRGELGARPTVGDTYDYFVGFNGHYFGGCSAAPPNGLFGVSQITTAYRADPAGLGIAAAGIILSAIRPPAIGLTALPPAAAHASSAVAGVLANDFHFNVGFAVASPPYTPIYVTLVGSKANAAQRGAITAAYPIGVVLNATSFYLNPNFDGPDNGGLYCNS